MKNYIFLLATLLISCKKDSPKDYIKPDNFPFSQISIDHHIKNVSEIKELRHLFETSSFIDEPGEVSKMKTTNVTSVLQLEKEKSFTFDGYRCFATIEKNNLKMSISYNTGLGGGGIKILTKNNTFSIRPISWDDIGGSENDNNYKINYQNLILDKTNYKIGDSVFGKLEVEIVKHFPTVDEKIGGERYYENEKFLTEKYSGYFQTIVKKEIIQ